MATWDIFHSDRLEVERNLTADQVRDGLDSGAIRNDDLARPAGSGEPWTPLADLPSLAAALGAADAGAILDDDDVIEGIVVADDEQDPQPKPAFTLTPNLHSDRGPGNIPLSDGTNKATTEDLDPTGFPDSYSRDLDLDLRDPRSKVLLPMDEEFDPGEEDEEAAEFTLSRSNAETVEELDLAAMVDVAFQLVLFFLVTASTIVFKTLEVPKPQAEQKPGAASQGVSSAKKMDELQQDWILVDIDDNGQVKVDREPAPSDFNGLVDRLRKLRKETGRTGMLLTANAATKHKYSVNAYDAANECSLRIGLAQPKVSTPAPIAAPGAPAPKK